MRAPNARQSVTACGFPAFRLPCLQDQAELGSQSDKLKFLKLMARGEGWRGQLLCSLAD